MYSGIQSIGEAGYCSRMCFSCEKSLTAIGTQTVRRLVFSWDIKVAGMNIRILVNLLEKFRSIWGKNLSTFNTIEIKFWEFYWIALEEMFLQNII